jgi:hypothetical protein
VELVLPNLTKPTPFSDPLDWTREFMLRKQTEIMPFDWYCRYLLPMPTLLRFRTRPVMTKQQDALANDGQVRLLKSFLEVSARRQPQGPYRHCRVAVTPSLLNRHREELLSAKMPVIFRVFKIPESQRKVQRLKMWTQSAWAVMQNRLVSLDEDCDWRAKEEEENPPNSKIEETFLRYEEQMEVDLEKDLHNQREP